jgi:hypothetical protein
MPGATRPVQGGAYTSPRSEPGGQNTPRAGRVVSSVGAYIVSTGLFMQQVDQGDIFDDAAIAIVTVSGTATESSNVGTPTAYDSVIDVDNPVSHWKLNQASLFVDRKALMHIPATTPVSLVSGLLANNGTDSAVSMTAGANSITKGALTGQGLPYETPTWSMEAWVKVSALAGAPAPTIFSRAFQVLKITGNITPPPRSVSPLVLSGGYLRAEITDTGNIVRNIDSAITFGSVYHLVATYDGTSMILYINGTELSRVATPAAKTLSSTAPDFSTTAQSASYVLDEVAWYGTALSPARVLAHYQAGNPSVTYTDSGTVTVSSSGTGSEDYSHDASSSDTITVLGTGTEYYNTPVDYIDATFGTITGSGSGIESYIYDDSGLATLTASGTGVESQVYTDSRTCTGTVLGSGFQTYTPYDSVLDEDVPVSHWKLGNVSMAIDRRQTMNLPAINGPIGTAAGLVANNGVDQANAFVAASGQQLGFNTGGVNQGLPYEGNAVTVEAWIKLASSTTTNYIASRYTAVRFSVTSSRALRATVTAGGTQFNVDSATSLINVGSTYHVVFSYDGANVILYVNGVEVKRTAITGAIQSLPDHFPMIGSIEGGGSYFDGTVDEVAWYNTALAPERILAHYQAGTATSYDAVVDADIPVSHWKLGWSTTKAVDRARRRLDLPAQNPPIAISDKGVVYQGDNDRANTFVRASSQRFRSLDSGLADSDATLYDTTTLSVEAWIKPTAASVVGGSWGVVRRPGSSIQLSLLNTKPRFEFNDPSNATKTVDGPLVQATAIYHLIGTYDGANLILYVNGAEAARLATATGIKSDLTLYPAIGLTGNYWDGDIDEVAWYNTALSPARVQAHFLAGLAGYVKVSGTGGDTAVYTNSALGSVIVTGSGVDDYQPPIGIDYTDSASGTITVLGTISESISVVDTSTGLIVASGTGVEAFSANDTGIGTLTASGTRTDNIIHTGSATGVVTASGSSLETFAHTGSGTCSITESGTATDTYIYSDTRTGTISVTGTSTEFSVYTDTRSGSITASGTGTDDYIYPDSSTGTIVVTGTGTDLNAHTGTGTGSITESGTGTDSYIYTDISTGTITGTGTGVDTVTYVDSDVGTAIVSGSSLESATHAASDTGTVVANGTSSETVIHSASAIGTIAVNGTGTDSQVYDDVGLGTTLLSGTSVESWAILIGYIDAQSGQINVNGTGVESLSHDSTAISIGLSNGTGVESQSHTSTAIGFGLVNGTRIESHSHTSTATGYVFVDGTAIESNDTAYTDFADGTVTSTGTGVDSVSYRATATGTVISTGTGDDAISYSATVSGTITFLGNGVDSGIYEDASTGVIVLTGISHETGYTSSIQPLLVSTVIALNPITVRVWSKTSIRSVVTHTTPIAVQIALQRNVKADVAQRDELKVLVTNH